MNWWYPFQGVGSSSAPPTSLSRWGSLTELLWRYAPTHRRIIRCWRPRGQILIVSFHVAIGWTAADPSVHLVLLCWSWHVSVLFKLDHRIDRRFPPMDRRFIQRCCLRGFSSPIHPMQLGKGPSVHPTLPVEFGLLCSVPSTSTLCTDDTVSSSDGVNFLPFLPRFWTDGVFGMWCFCILGT
jgi:hypothetical protein